MANKKDQIRLLENLHRSYSEALSQDFSAETKDKINNLLEMIDSVIRSLEKQSHETKLQKIAKRIKTKVIKKL
jgi:DNA polymerase/3'-5' exonuclease PolX